MCASKDNIDRVKKVCTESEKISTNHKTITKDKQYR